MKKLFLLVLGILLIAPVMSAQAAPFLPYNHTEALDPGVLFEYEGYAPDDDGEGSFYRHATAEFTNQGDFLQIVMTNWADDTANPNQLLAGIFFDYRPGLGDPVSVSLSQGSYISLNEDLGTTIPYPYNLSSEYGYRTDADARTDDAMPQYFISGSSMDPLGVLMVDDGLPGSAGGKDYMMGNPDLGNPIEDWPIVVNSVTVMWERLFYPGAEVPMAGQVGNVVFAYGTSYDAAPVPEPATLLLLGTGLIGLAGVGRKKFKK